MRPSKGRSFMVTLRRGFYTTLLLCVALLPAIGCGKPAPPPPGAPKDANAPTIDLGTESNAGTPAGGLPTSQGEQK